MLHKQYIDCWQPNPRERDKIHAQAAKKPKKEVTAPVAADPEAIKTLVLTGLPSDITKAVLWKRVRKVHESIDLRFPVEGEEATGEFTPHIDRQSADTSQLI